MEELSETILYCSVAIFTNNCAILSTTVHPSGLGLRRFQLTLNAKSIRDSHTVVPLHRIASHFYHCMPLFGERNAVLISTLIKGVALKNVSKKVQGDFD